jgi:hypothetical protein
MTAPTAADVLAALKATTAADHAQWLADAIRRAS